MLDADGHDNPAGREPVPVGEGELEAVPPRDHLGDGDLVDLQAEFGLEPLAVADERVQRDRDPVSPVGKPRGLAESRRRLWNRLCELRKKRSTVRD